VVQAELEAALSSDDFKELKNVSFKVSKYYIVSSNHSVCFTVCIMFRPMI
jgi:hypothetical protein